MFINFGDLFYLLGDVFLISSALILLVYFIYLETFIKKTYLNKIGNRILIAVVCVLLLLAFYSQGFENIIFNNSFLINDFYWKSRIIILFFLLFILIIMNVYIEEERNFSVENFILLLLLTEGIFLAISANNLFVLYLALELQNMSIYILISTRRYNILNIEATLKYFIVSVLSSVCILYGISLIYGCLGTLNYQELAKLLVNIAEDDLNMNMVLIISFLLILIGFFIKLGVAPFHWWVPSVYQGVSYIILPILSIYVKIGLTFILIKLYTVLFCFFIDILYIVFIIVGLCSIIVGTFNAISEFNVKRFLGYSSVSNIGFIIVILGINTYLSLIAVYFYIIVYSFTLLGFFVFIFSLKDWHKNEIKYLSDLTKYANMNKLAAFNLMITICSLGGVPIFIGFYSKLLILYVCVSTYNYWLAAILLLITFISIFYYIRIIRFIFFRNTREYVFLKPLGFWESFWLSFYGVLNFSGIIFVNFIMIQTFITLLGNFLI